MAGHRQNAVQAVLFYIPGEEIGLMEGILRTK